MPILGSVLSGAVLSRTSRVLAVQFRWESLEELSFL